MREPRNYGALRRAEREVDAKGQDAQPTGAAQHTEGPVRPAARYQQPGGPSSGDRETIETWGYREVERKHNLRQAALREHGGSASGPTRGEGRNQALQNDVADRQQLREHGESGALQSPEHAPQDTLHDHQNTAPAVEQRPTAEPAPARTRHQQRAERAKLRVEHSRHEAGKNISEPDYER